MTDLAIEVKDLRKTYGEVEAVRGVSFEVASGEGLRLPRAQLRSTFRPTQPKGAS